MNNKIKISLASEMYNLQQLFGVDEVNMILGDLKSYKLLREKYSYQIIYNEVLTLIETN